MHSLWLVGLVTPALVLYLASVLFELQPVVFWLVPQFAEIVSNAKFLSFAVLATPPGLLMPVNGRCSLCFPTTEPSPKAIGFVWDNPYSPHSPGSSGDCLERVLNITTRKER